MKTNFIIVLTFVHNKKYKVMQNLHANVLLNLPFILLHANVLLNLPFILFFPFFLL
jgi:hypothetical protein